MKIIPNTSTLLRKTCEPVDLSKLDEIKLIAAEMHKFVRDHNAIGLAAPQVGIDLQLFVLNSIEHEITCINPEILMSSSDTAPSHEGCLSFPKLFLKVARPTWINVGWTNLEGVKEQHALENEAAAAWLHEYDHINGILFTDRAGPVSLMMAKKKAAKLIKLTSKQKTVLSI